MFATVSDRNQVSAQFSSIQFSMRPVIARSFTLSHSQIVFMRFIGGREPSELQQFETE